MTSRYQGLVIFLGGMMAGLVMSYIVGSAQFGPLYRTPLAASPTTCGTTVIYIERNESITSRNSTSDELINHGPPVSHDDLDKLPRVDKPIHFDDGHAHNDDTSAADELHKTVRVLCWVMTSPENLQSKAVHVRETWGKRCNKLLFISDKEDKDFPAVGINVEHGRDHLTAKTMKAFDYIFEHHLDEADWFLKADDDTYVIVENLRYLLSAHDPQKPAYLGHLFKVIVRQGYMSGGGGYVLSKEALIRYGNRRENLCAKDHGAEDVEIGQCMQKLDVPTVDSRDSLGRTRFHCFNPETHLHGGYPDWYYQYDKYGAQKGIANMSDYAVTFHYVSVQQMYDLEYYVYHLRPYGIRSGYQDLNKDNKPPA